MATFAVGVATVPFSRPGLRHFRIVAPVERRLQKRPGDRPTGGAELATGLHRISRGRRIASLVPGAQFLPLPTTTHYFPVDDDVTLRMADAIDRLTH